MLPTVSIICVNYNGKQQIREFINSVKKLNYPRQKVETIVVDNASSDRSTQLILRLFPKVKLIPLKRNIGYGPALNIGISHAQSSYFFIANNDLVIHPDSLKTLIDYNTKHPEVGILGGQIISKITGFPSSGYQTFNYWTGTVKMINKDIKKIAEVPWVQGCAMLIAKTTIEKIGLFDERFSKTYFEDLDLCKRAQYAGYKTVINPQAIFYHYQSFTMDGVVQKYVKWYYWNKSKIGFIFKYGNFWQIFTVLSLQFVSSIFKSILNHPYHVKLFSKALLWNLKNRHRNFLKYPSLA